MSTFLITIAVLLLLGAGALLTKKPGEVNTNPGAGVLLVRFVLNVSLAVWALNLLIGGAA